MFAENYLGFAQVDVKGGLLWGKSLSDGTTPNNVALLYSVGSRYNSLGNNLIGAASANVDFTQEFNAAGDATNVTNGVLGALADNGGPTKTHALLAGSPAINTGTCTDHSGATVTTDQRGISRPQGAGCDKGAYESEETSGLPAPNFTFVLPSLTRTYGDASFSVASYAASTNSSAGPIAQSFQIGKASLTVTANDETITYGTPPSFGVGYSNFVGSDNASSPGRTVTYTFTGTGGTAYGLSGTPPTNAGTYSITPAGYSSADYNFSYLAGTLTINKAAGSVSIANLPTSAQPAVGGSFTPTYFKNGDGTAFTSSITPSVCTVSGSVFDFAAAGTCTLQASVTEGTNHLSATGADQSFIVYPAFASVCTSPSTTRRTGSAMSPSRGRTPGRACRRSGCALPGPCRRRWPRATPGRGARTCRAER